MQWYSDQRHGHLEWVSQADWYRALTFVQPKVYFQNFYPPVREPKFVRTSDESWFRTVDDPLGATLIVWGSAMLVPGPIDVAAAGLGVLVFKHPLGAVAGVLAYNAFALGTMALGYWLISLD